MSDRALTGSRILSAPIPPYNGTFTAGTFPGHKGWQAMAGGVFHEAYFDLSAYELDDLTAIPTLLQLQDALPYKTAGTLPADFQLGVFDIISQERIDPAVVATDWINGEYPSSPGTVFDWSQILMCNFRYMLPQSDFLSTQLLLPATGGALGSSEPTAASKLWHYRIFCAAGLSLEAVSLFAPATRFIAGIEVVEEKELPYLMRLKRSFELATQG